MRIKDALPERKVQVIIKLMHGKSDHMTITGELYVDFSSKDQEELDKWGDAVFRFVIPQQKRYTFVVDAPASATRA